MSQAEKEKLVKELTDVAAETMVMPKDAFYAFLDEYKEANEPKELIVVPGATHCDLYDQMDKIPFHRLVDFFDKVLRK